MSKFRTAACLTIFIALPLIGHNTPDAAAAFHKRLPKDQEVLHALNRLMFGPRPGDAEQVAKLGVHKWIEAQLHPERIPENPILAARLEPLASLTMTSEELVRNYPPRKLVENSSESKPGPRPQQVLASELQHAKVYRAVYSNRQLAEVLTDFWFNHFNVFLDKAADRYLTTEYERVAIRPHILGKFRDLLEATAESPAMLFYLDNWQSVAPGAAPLAVKRARGLNENYARELLELHTLGVDGGYTQKDIVEVARCFTGWTIVQPRRGGRFFFNQRFHDKGEKVVLGVTIAAGGGIEDGRKVLDLLARHPSTARFISKELAVRFVADNPPESLVAAMAAAFRRTGGDLRQVMRTMLNSREFWSEGSYRSKVKSPLEMVASALRATNADVTFAGRVAQQIAQLGQPLYRKQEPTGYPNSSEEWVNSAALVGRMNFALALASNRLPGVSVDEGVSAMALGSPEFQRK